MIILQFNKIGVAISLVFISLFFSVAQAAPLIPFSNGSVADADDVNSNFTELETRINNINGLETYSWTDFKPSGWTSKVFVVTGDATKDKQIRSYINTATSTTTGVIKRTLETSLAGNTVGYRIDFFSYDNNGKRLLYKREHYQTDKTTLDNTVNYTPGINTGHNAIGIGLVWGSTSSYESVGPDGTTILDTGFIGETRTYTAIEDITVRGVAYTGCATEYRESGFFSKKLVVFCPNGVGLVKLLKANTDGTVVIYEFDPAQSTAAP